MKLGGVAGLLGNERSDVRAGRWARGQEQVAKGSITIRCGNIYNFIPSKAVAHSVVEVLVQLNHPCLELIDVLKAPPEQTPVGELLELLH